MIDVNNEVRAVLNNLEGITVTYRYPDKSNKLPVVSYYEITTTTGLCYDNKEQAQKSYVAVDIWGRNGAECADFAIKADKLMQDAGWYREFSMDLPPKNKIYHKSMRFFKEIFFEI